MIIGRRAFASGEREGGADGIQAAEIIPDNGPEHRQCVGGPGFVAQNPASSHVRKQRGW
jgi:hypothetical protein